MGGNESFNYPTDKENTQMDFFDSFHNIKKFIQFDHFKKRTIIYLKPIRKECAWNQKTVKTQILRFRFLRDSESIFLVP
jgi:predicted NACHT family NTPase